MKKVYRQLVVLESGEYQRAYVNTTKTAEQLGEQVWNETEDIFLVEIREDHGTDYYIRNVK